MSKLEKLRAELQSLEDELQDLCNNKPPRLTQEDTEDISDNYQAHLEWNYAYGDLRDQIKEIEQKIEKESV